MAAIKIPHPHSDATGLTIPRCPGWLQAYIASDMGYYALLVPGFTGHLNPMIGLGRALQRQGHRLVIISVLEAEEKVRRAGFQFEPIATIEFPRDEWARMTERMGELTGLKATRFGGRWLQRFVRGILRDLPEVVRRERFDGLVMDQLSLGAESVCEVSKVPLAVACCSLLGHAESRVPPIVFNWPYRTSGWCRVRNVIGQFILISTGWPIVLELMPFRYRHKLRRMTYNFGNELPPSLVQVVQTPSFFDFPRRHLPLHVHHTGPWNDRSGGSDADFPWSRLNGQPIIYGSFGTLQNRLATAFRMVAEACAGLEVQLVLTLGTKGAPVPENLPGDPIVVDYAPQLALIRCAQLAITHGGLNTTLECLSEGLPLVVLPITNDQPGVASRVARLGAGEIIPIQKLTAPRLREAIRRVLSSPTYRRNAQECAREIQRLDGASQAAELVDRAFQSGRRISRVLPATDI